MTEQTGRKPTTNSPVAVHFGAGNIGRGFIGLLLTNSNYELTFITRNRKKIKELQSRNEYPVNIANECKKRHLVKNVSCISTQNRKGIAALFEEAQLITTAVGMKNLRNIAPKIAYGIEHRLKTYNTYPLHIIACENALHNSSTLKQYVYEHLPEKYHRLANQLIAFPNTVVDRIVPTKHHADPLEVTVEPYYEWIIDRSAMLEGLPPIKGVKIVDSLEAFIERKLFTVNTGHCSIAYLGHLNGYTKIHEVMADPNLSTEVQQVIHETGKLLIDKHDFDKNEHLEYIERTLKRFSNPHITDEIVRVGRSPIRKLSLNERLVRPAIQSFNRGLEVSNLTKAIAAALLYDNREDTEAIELKQAIEKYSIHDVIVNYIGIPQNHPIHQTVVKKYKQLKKKYILSS